MILVTEYWYLSHINTLLEQWGERAKHFKSLENPKKTE